MMQDELLNGIIGKISDYANQTEEHKNWMANVIIRDLEKRIAQLERENIGLLEIIDAFRNPYQNTGRCD